MKQVLAFACAGLFAAGAAQAAASFSQALVAGPNTISDDNAELVLKYDSGVLGNYRVFNPILDVIGKNDILVGAVGMTSFPTGALGTSASLYNEVTGIYAVQVDVATPLLGGCGHPGITTCTHFDFIAPTIGLNAALGKVNGLHGTAFPVYTHTTTNSFAVVLEDDDGSPTAFDRSAATWAALFASYADGTQLMTLDLDLPSGDYFFTNGPADVKQISLPPPGANAGSFGGRSTISYEAIPGWDINPASPYMTITGNIQAATAGAANIWSDSTYRFEAQRVPEPSSLTLIGLALAAAGVVGYSRRQRQP